MLVPMREAARRCGRSVATMRAWRRSWLPGGGRVGPEPLPDAAGTIMYLDADVTDWINRVVEAGRAKNTVTAR